MQRSNTSFGAVTAHWGRVSHLQRLRLAHDTIRECRTRGRSRRSLPGQGECQHGRSQRGENFWLNAGRVVRVGTKHSAVSPSSRGNDSQARLHDTGLAVPDQGARQQEVHCRVRGIRGDGASRRAPARCPRRSAAICTRPGLALRDREGPTGRCGRRRRIRRPGRVESGQLAPGARPPAREFREVRIVLPRCGSTVRPRSRRVSDVPHARPFGEAAAEAAQIDRSPPRRR